jgi:hypothetical protein
MTEIVMSVDLSVIHVTDTVVENYKCRIIGDDLGVLGKNNVIVVSYFIDRYDDVNFTTKLNT